MSETTIGQIPDCEPTAGALAASDALAGHGRVDHRQEAAAMPVRLGRNGLSLTAKGLTHREISARLAEVYGVSVSRTIAAGALAA